MFYHDLLKKELFDYINLEYSKKNIKEVPNKSSFNIEIPTNIPWKLKIEEDKKNE